MSRRALGRQTLRYLIVGGGNVAFTLAVFWLFDRLWTDTIGVQAVYWSSSLIGIINGFIWQRILVWRSTGSWRKEFLKFVVVNLAVSIANSGLLFLTVTLIGWPAFLSQVAITAVLVLTTFLINRAWVFRAGRPQGATAHDTSN